jgi:hypothetical protein
MLYSPLPSTPIRYIENSFANHSQIMCVPVSESCLERMLVFTLFFALCVYMSVRSSATCLHSRETTETTRATRIPVTYAHDVCIIICVCVSVFFLLFLQQLVREPILLDAEIAKVEKI